MFLRSQAYPTGEQIVNALRPSFDAPVRGQHWVTSSRVVKGLRGRWSLDYFICPREKRRWNRQAERFGSLEVDHQLQLRRLLHGQVGGFQTLENLVDVSRDAPIRMSNVR